MLHNLYSMDSNYELIEDCNFKKKHNHEEHHMSEWKKGSLAIWDSFILMLFSLNSTCCLLKDMRVP